MALKIDHPHIQFMCQNVTAEMRAFCLKHIGYAQFPEEWARGGRGIENAKVPFTAQFWWEKLNDVILHESAPNAAN
jgi:hypothetical protein